MARVLLLHTGGTLGMEGAPLKPSSYASRLLGAVPELEQIAEIETEIVFDLDSSDIGPPHWAELAQRICAHGAAFDGYVIVHGTDTMAYTASALSFALEGLNRPVILTGAQRPLAALRSDARRNLTDAVELASLPIPEVAICFDGVLLRGCRATKTHTRSYRAFESPGCAPLARLGVDVRLSMHVRAPRTALRAPPARFDGRVATLRARPGMSAEGLRAWLAASDARALVLEAFGSGTFPSAGGRLADELARVVEEGMPAVVISSSSGGVSLGLYQNSLGLREAGVIEGGEMGLEAALTKMMYALGTRGDDRAALRAYMERNVAGELASLESARFVPAPRPAPGET